MQWRDEGVLLTVRPHGETAMIIDVLTADHGRHAGVVRGGTSRKIAPILQPGAQLDVTWTARRDSHLGSFTVDPIKSRAVDLMSSRLALAGANAVAALLNFALPEREPAGGTYVRSIALFDMIGTNPLWPLAYLKWEVALLEALGFGLDLSTCAVTGRTEGLIYVSPKSGRAVSAEGAGEWADRMLPLSPALVSSGISDPEEVLKGLKTTGYFLESWLAPALGDKPLPTSRKRFVDALTRETDLKSRS